MNPDQLTPEALKKLMYDRNYLLTELKYLVSVMSVHDKSLEEFLALAEAREAIAKAEGGE